MSPFIVSGYTTMSVVALLLLIVSSVPVAYASTSTGRAAYMGVMIPVCFAIYVAAAYYVLHRPLSGIAKAAGHSSGAPVEIVLTSLRSSGCLVASSPVTPGGSGVRLGNVCTKELAKLVYSLPHVYREVAALRAHCAKLGLLPRDDEEPLAARRDPFELQPTHRSSVPAASAEQKVREWEAETPATAPAGSATRRNRNVINSSSGVTLSSGTALETSAAEDPPRRRKKRVLVRRKQVDRPSQMNNVHNTHNDPFMENSGQQLNSAAAAEYGRGIRAASSNKVRTAHFLDPPH